jgi:succinate dehydrogenase / fumarate reductase membrane anchor subunit
MQLTSGLRAWLLQRASAVYLALFSLLLLAIFLFDPPADALAWRQRFGESWFAVGWLLFLLALVVHGWVGMRDILIDYVHPLAWRMALMLLIWLLLLGSGLWGMLVVLQAAG